MSPWTPPVVDQVVKSNNHQQGLDAPTFNPSTDAYSWVKAVTEWSELIVQGATSGINRAYTGQLNTMSRQLYRALPQPHQQILDNAQAEGQIDYKQENQVRAVKDIVDLLGMNRQCHLSRA
jgi:TRAP-type C4-dicarboxylate transport system substrate-binding protein